MEVETDCVDHEEYGWFGTLHVPTFCNATIAQGADRQCLQENINANHASSSPLKGEAPFSAKWVPQK